MGTDIHPIVEVRRKGVWRTHHPKTECPYYYEFNYVGGAGKPLTRVYQQDANGNRIRSRWDGCPTRLPEAFGNRNYAKFAILANVRNDGIPFIDEDRGIPDDLAAGSRAWEKAGEYDHSHGWVTLAELLEYDTGQTYEEEGIIPGAEYDRLKAANELPGTWSGGIGGSGVTIVDAETYEQLPKDVTFYVEGKYRPGIVDPAKFYVLHKWTQPVSRMIDEELIEIIEYMRVLVPKTGTPEDVRLLFYFDS